jgi:hypothetical protein
MAGEKVLPTSRPSLKDSESAPLKDIRYGIFLRPDPATCWNVTQITTAVREQFGLRSAGAFPPHATLIGNLATGASETEIVALLDPVFDGLQTFTVYNAGISRQEKNTFEYNVNLDASGQNPNEHLRLVAAAVKRAVLPISVPVDDYLVTPVADYEFAGHLGLASHELAVDSRISDEIGEFIAGLPLVAPASFAAEWYSLFEFKADWTAPWWEHLTWRHLKSWRAISQSFNEFAGGHE